MTDMERHRTERGMILRLLAAGNQSRFVPRGALMRMMDRSGYPVSSQGLEFHLSYLTEQGYLTAKLARDVPGHLDLDSRLAPDDIVFVKLAAKGLQLLNNPSLDPEVVV